MDIPIDQNLSSYLRRVCPYCQGMWDRSRMWLLSAGLLSPREAIVLTPLKQSNVIADNVLLLFVIVTIFSRSAQLRHVTFFDNGPLLFLSSPFHLVMRDNKLETRTHFHFGVLNEICNSFCFERFFIRSTVFEIAVLYYIVNRESLTLFQIKKSLKYN